MNTEIPKTSNEKGPVVLICDDDGTSIDEQKLHVAIFFPSRKKAEVYEKNIILGKNGRTSIYPVKIQ